MQLGLKKVNAFQNVERDKARKTKKTSVYTTISSNRKSGIALHQQNNNVIIYEQRSLKNVHLH